MRQSRDRSPSHISKAVFRASAAGATPEGDAFFTTTQPKNTEVTNFLLADHNTDFRDKVNVKMAAFTHDTFADTANPKASADIFFILVPKPATT